MCDSINILRNNTWLKPVWQTEEVKEFALGVQEYQIIQVLINKKGKKRKKVKKRHDDGLRPSCLETIRQCLLKNTN